MRRRNTTIDRVPALKPPVADRLAGFLAEGKPSG